MGPGSMGQGPWVCPIIPLRGPIIPLKGFYFAITGISAAPTYVLTLDASVHRVIHPCRGSQPVAETITEAD